MSSNIRRVLSRSMGGDSMRVLWAGRESFTGDSYLGNSSTLPFEYSLSSGVPYFEGEINAYLKYTTSGSSTPTYVGGNSYNATYKLGIGHVVSLSHVSKTSYVGGFDGTGISEINYELSLELISDSMVFSYGNNRPEVTSVYCTGFISVIGVIYEVNM